MPPHKKFPNKKHELTKAEELEVKIANGYVTNHNSWQYQEKNDTRLGNTSQRKKR